jgi:hypothetical protein
VSFAEEDERIKVSLKNVASVASLYVRTM